MADGKTGSKASIPFFSGEESVVNGSSIMSPSIDGSETEHFSASSVSISNFDPDGFNQTPQISEKKQVISHNTHISQRQKVNGEDPLSMNFNDMPKIRTESLTIRQADESRIVAAMATAAKKQTTGSVFSVKVDLGSTGALGIGVKDLSGNLLAVSMLKRANGQPGAGEAAGVRLGDVVFGVNFIAVREGSRTLLSVLKRENERRRRSVHLQCWRCHQLCSDPIPGALFPRADDVIVQAYALFRNNVFSDWERWNFIEILLSHMLDEMKLRAALESAPNRPEYAAQQQAKIRAKQLQMIDLERNILQAKGLRTALCVRIVHTKAVEDTVVYVLRIEDVETGLQWVVHRRYRDFYALNTELSDLSTYTKDITFPNKRMSLRIARERLIEQRVVGLEQYVRRVLHTLTLYASMDPSASRSLRHLQNFLGVDKYIDCIHPPKIDDQRFIELAVFRLLNDFNSPACQQCVRFVANIDLDSLVGPDSKDGFRPMLAHISQALSEVDTFMLTNYQQQLEQMLTERNQKLSKEQVTTFVKRCVRRQVEAAIFLPLRRQVLKIIFPFINAQAHEMQHALHILQQASPKYFTVDPCVLQAKAFPRAIKAFREVIHAYLPADQGQLLMHAAGAVMELYSESLEMKPSTGSASATSENNNNNNNIAVEAPVAGITAALSASNLNRIRGGSADIVSQASKTIQGSDPISRSKSVGGNEMVNAATTDELETSKVNSKKLEMLLMPTKLHMLLSPDETRLSNSTLFEGTDTPVADPPPKPQSSLLVTDNKKSSHSLDPTNVVERELLPVPPGTSSQTVLAQSPPLVLSPCEPESEQHTPTVGPALSLSSKEIGDSNTVLQAVANSSLYEEMELEKSRTEILAHAHDGELEMAQPTAMKRYDSESLPTAIPERLNSPDIMALEADLKAKLPELNEAAASGSTTSLHQEDTQDKDNNNDANIRSSILSAGSDKEGVYSIHHSGFFEQTSTQKTVVSADDFLPLFTFVLVQADMPQLVLVKELMMTLVADEETYGECGYYMATLEAAVHHITDLARQYQRVVRSASNGNLDASFEDEHDEDEDDDDDNTDDDE